MLAWLKVIATLGGLLSKIIDLVREAMAASRARAIEQQHSDNEKAIDRAFDPVTDPTLRVRQPSDKPSATPAEPPAVPGSESRGA